MERAGMRSLKKTLSRLLATPSTRIFALALGYFLSGRLCLLLSLPPEYGSPIFLPAGIALAAFLLMGYRAGIGVWLGALCVNLTGLPVPASSPPGLLPLI